MKKAFLLTLLFLGVSFSYSQSSKFSYNITLSTVDSIDTQKYLNQNPCLDFERQLGTTSSYELKLELVPMFTHEELKKIVDSDIESYQYNLKNNTFWRTTATAEKQKIDKKLADYAGLQKELEDFVMKCITDNIKFGYKDNFWFFKWNKYKFYSLFHYKISNKSFRDALYNKAVDVLCAMVAYYPKDYKTKLIREFTKALNTLEEAPKHKYEIKEDISKSWKPIVFFIDGVPNEDFGYGLIGFLFRRIYMDNIPYSEIYEKTANLVAKVKMVDVSKNANYFCKYTINNEMLYCIGSEENYFVSMLNNKKMITYSNPYEIAYYPNIIKARYNDGEYFYQISNYRWSNTELKTVIVDKYMNVIFHEPNTLSEPISITTPQKNKQQTQKQPQKTDIKPQLSK